MINIKFVFPSDNGLLGVVELPSVPNQGDSVFISGVEHKVIRRIFRVTDNPEKIVEVELSEVQ